MLESTAIESMATEPSSSAEVASAAALLAVVAEPVRWRLLAELSRAGQRCVCDLQPVGGVAANVLSYHLKVLRDAGLVTASKRGRWVDYALSPGAAQRLERALPTAETKPLPPATRS